MPIMFLMEEAKKFATCNLEVENRVLDACLLPLSVLRVEFYLIAMLQGIVVPVFCPIALLRLAKAVRKRIPLSVVI